MLLKLGPGTQQLPELVRGKREESPTLWVSLWYIIKSQCRSKRFITSIFTGEIYTCFLQRNWPKSRELNWEEETPTGISAKTCSWWQPQLSHTRQSPAQTPKPGECRGGQTKKHQLWSRDTQHAWKVTQPRAEGAHGQQLHSQSITQNTEQCKWPRGEHSPELQNTGQRLQSQSRACCLQLELFPLHWHQTARRFLCIYQRCSGFFVGCCCLNYILLF